MVSKTEMKYKRKSERTKLNSNWNENDFKTKMITYNVKKAGISVHSDQTPATTPDIIFNSHAIYSRIPPPPPSTETIQVSVGVR